MKKLFLPFLFAFICSFTHAQTQGFSWKFGSTTPPFISTPLIAGSPDLNLATLGAGSVTPGINESLSIGSSCTGNMEVASFTNNFGFNFTNDDGAGVQPVTTTYAIEMVVKFDAAGSWIRLLGFSDINNTADEQGIYISSSGEVVVYYDNASPYYTSPEPIDPSVWQHLTFVRDGAAQKILYYQNGILKAVFNDNGANPFIPKATNNYDINFFKDNTDEESSGHIFKLNLYNRVLSSIEILNSYNNICNPSFLLSTNKPPSQGYQWMFGNTPMTPFSSTSAIGGGTINYPLTAIGTGNITQEDNADLISLTAGCGGTFKVAAFTKEAGLSFSNDPNFAGDNYTVEMVVNFNEDGNWIKLFGFTDINDVADERGVYINSGGTISFYNGSNNTIPGSTETPIVAGQWYHLMFIRSNTNGTISYYQNGILRGSFEDNGPDLFIPSLENNYAINFFKDNTTEEAGGKLMKLAVFNFALTSWQVQQRFINICIPSEIPLPVSLTNFSAEKNEEVVTLLWSTLSEQNSNGFEIQRSNNEQSGFSTIGFVSTAASSGSKKDYVFYDRSPLKGKNFYRLKQIDLNNRFKLSSVRMVDMDKTIQDIQVFPNPASNFITVTNLKAGSSLSVFNNQGQRIITKTTGNTQEQIAVEKLTKGVYVIQVTETDGHKRTVRFTKL